MIIDPRMIDLMVKNYHQDLKKDHEIFRRYGSYHQVAPDQPSRISKWLAKWIDRLADRLIRLGYWLKLRTGCTKTVYRNGCS